MRGIACQRQGTTTSANNTAHLEPQSLLTSQLRHSGIRRQITPQDRQVSTLLQWVVQRPDDLLRTKVNVSRIGVVLCERLSSDGQLAAVEEVGVFEEIFDEGGHTAGFVEVLHDEFSGGPEVAEPGGLVADGLEVVDGEFDVGGTGHGEEVKDLKIAFVSMSVNAG